MKLENPCCFTNPDTREEILYGAEGQYRHISLDFNKDVYPHILKALLDLNLPKNDFKDYSLNPSYYPLDPDHVLAICMNLIVFIFHDCFEVDFQKNYSEEDNVLKREGIKALEKRKGLLGAFARTAKIHLPLGLLNL